MNSSVSLAEIKKNASNWDNEMPVYCFEWPKSGVWKPLAEKDAHEVKKEFEDVISSGHYMNKGFDNLSGKCDSV